MNPSHPASKRTASRRALHAVGLTALVAVGMGGSDSPSGVGYAASTCTSSSPGAMDYCASTKCGPCADGEGDCDPGQCAAGLTCVEEGAVDHCRPVGCSGSSPGAMDYCASTKCGPCGDGEGDCDPGQCAAGLTCVEEGAVDHCRPVGACTASSPGAMDYCASTKCGPCADGEGDCDPGQCAAGLECVEEGAVDHCRPVSACTASSPGASDYCLSTKCGPCADGEGDCDPGQCAAGLECVEEGAVDHCRPVGPRKLQVEIDGLWEDVCCDGGIPELSGVGCGWTMYDRTLTDESANLKLDCPEGGPTDCTCDGSGERMHGTGGADLAVSVDASGGGPVYPDYTQPTCVVVDSSGALVTDWTDSSCPYFRLN